MELEVEVETPLLAADGPALPRRSRRKPPAPHVRAFTVVGGGVSLIVALCLWCVFVYTTLHPRVEGVRRAASSAAALSSEEEGELDKITTRITDRHQKLRDSLAGPVQKLPPGVKDRVGLRMETLDTDLLQWDGMDNATRLALSGVFEQKAGEARHLKFEVEKLLDEEADDEPELMVSEEPASPKNKTTTTTIPRTIHMTWANHELQGVPQDVASAVRSWRDLNPGWEVRVWDDCDILDFVASKFPKFAKTFEQLVPVERADLFRYLVLLKHGGVFTDVDTVCLEPIANWDPAHSARVIVGLQGSFPSLNDALQAGVSRQTQFCQWTIAAAPNHPLLASVAHRVLSAQAAQLAQRTNQSETTGPGAWTDAVTEYLDWFLRSPSDVVHGGVVGDIKFLDIQAFGNTQPHSGALPWNDPSLKGRALVRHLFAGLWRNDAGEVPRPTCPGGLLRNRHAK